MLPYSTVPVCRTTSTSVILDKLVAAFATARRAASSQLWGETASTSRASRFCVVAELRWLSGLLDAGVCAYISADSLSAADCALFKWSAKAPVDSGFSVDLALFLMLLTPWYLYLSDSPHFCYRSQFALHLTVVNLTTLRCLIYKVFWWN